MSRYGETSRAYGRERIATQEWDYPDDEESREVTVLPGHCPVCSLEYELAESLTGRRSHSDMCSLCELEEAR